MTRQSTLQRSSGPHCQRKHRRLHATLQAQLQNLRRLNQRIKQHTSGSHQPPPKILFSSYTKPQRRTSSRHTLAPMPPATQRCTQSYTSAADLLPLLTQALSSVSSPLQQLSTHTYTTHPRPLPYKYYQQIMLIRHKICHVLIHALRRRRELHPHSLALSRPTATTVNSGTTASVESFYLPTNHDHLASHAKSFYLPTNQRRLSGGIMALKGFFQ